MVPTRWEELYANRESIKNLSNPEFCGKVCRSSSFVSFLTGSAVENSQEALEILARKWR